ncbi:site-specific integrase [Streptococcus caprae]|uniref:Site-specific integrase n=1 Tax=Streptococcus caprae TaxID=1640501 RepID=A0ABV8CY23_9STRE
MTKYLDHLYCYYLKSSTLKRKIASLKAFYRYLEEQNIISENPFHHKRFRFKSEKILPKTIPLMDLKNSFIIFNTNLQLLKQSTPLKKLTINN